LKRFKDRVRKRVFRLLVETRQRSK
jgi:hypothetical protein